MTMEAQEGGKAKVHIQGELNNVKKMKDKKENYINMRSDATIMVREDIIGYTKPEACHANFFS